MPNLNNLYNSERASYIQRNKDEESAERIPEADYLFEVRVETDIRQVYRHLQRLLNTYKEEKRGPTIIALQAGYEESGLCLSDYGTLVAALPVVSEFPVVPIHISDNDTLYNVLDWQRVGARCMLKHFLKADVYLQVVTRKYLKK